VAVTAEAGLRLLQAIHGHAGWLAVAALLHPALILRRPGRPATWATRAGVGLVSAVALGGALLYPAYRVEVRPGLCADQPALAWWFERKEALAIAAVALTWAGGGAAGLAVRGGGVDERARLRLAAAVAFSLAAATAAGAATIGTLVASVRGF
jgi:hypothetical protein